MQIFIIQPNLKIQIEKWLCFLQKNRHYSDKTIQAYHNDMLIFINFINQYKKKSCSLNDIMALKLADFRVYFDHRKNTDFIIHRSLTRNLAAIKNFYTYQEHHTGLRNEDLAHLTIRYKNKSLPRPIEETDIFLILEYLKNASHHEKWICLRNYALAMLLYGAGLRMSEALGLTLADISTERTYLVIKGKGNKIYHVPYTEIIREAITKYLNECPYPLNSDSPIFRGSKGGILGTNIFYVTLIKARHYLDIPTHFSPHSFRHSCASHLLNNGANLRSIQSLMGHKKLSATEHYLKIDHHYLRTIIQKAHPRKS